MRAAILGIVAVILAVTFACAPAATITPEPTSIATTPASPASTRTPSPTPTPTPLPTYTPSPTPPPPTPTPKAYPEREAILAFTRQALAIEAGRDELVNLRERYPYFVIAYLFLRGPRDSSLPGALKLKAQLVLLDCPPVLQDVKSSLIEIYSLEIDEAQLESQRDISSLTLSLIYFDINRSNVDSYKKAGSSRIDMNSPWVIAQELRRDTYIKWSEILHQHAIDGFTGLTTPAGQSQGAPYLVSRQVSSLLLGA